VAVLVFEVAGHRVDVTVTRIVPDSFDERLIVGLALCVLDGGLDLEKELLPVDVREDLWHAVPVGEEEEVFDPVPDAVSVLVDVIVLEEVDEPVVVRDSFDDFDRSGVPVDVFEDDDDCVVAPLFTGVRVCISDRLGNLEATAVFVLVVVRVDVFDWVDVDVSAIPLTIKCLCMSCNPHTGRTSAEASELSMKRKYR
jgi:hypothetical protein